MQETVKTQEFILTEEKIAELLESGNWMLRFSDNGNGYGDFQWKPLGQWTEALDWHGRAECSGGLFGQSMKGAGFCKPGKRMELCETQGRQIVIHDEKVKVRRARIIALNEYIPVIFLEKLQSVGGYLDLEGYAHPLPEGLQSVGGSLYLRGYTHPLPEGLKKKR